MTAVTVPAAAEALIPVTADEIITHGREIYRRAQQAGWPDEGRDVLLRASSRLWTETEICARVRDDGFQVTPGRLARAREAASGLLQALHSYCGAEAAAIVSGEAGQVAA